MKKIQAASRGFSLLEILIVMICLGVLSAMTLPTLSRIRSNLRADGDMRSLAGDVTLAKMRAAASFSRARVRADTTARTYQVEVWNKTGPSWSIEGGVQYLSTGITFSYGSLTTAPPNTQTTLNQAAACQTDAETTAGTVGDIANTACIVFSSRGIPITYQLLPTSEGAFYISDGSSVQGVTASASGLIRTWRTDQAATNWKSR